MHRVGIVVCYFGKWPRGFDIFLKTCAGNPTVHFLFFTDAEPPGRLPGNLVFKPFRLDDLKALSSKKLGMNVAVKTPYKVCDLRPAFGVIFEEYLQDFDFWGYCDLDVVFGNLRHFLTEEVFSTYDVIATRKEYVSGHFTLYRNAERIRRLYEESADYRRVFQEETHWAFDECNFLWHYLLNGGSLLDTKADVDSMTHVLKRLAARGTIQVCFENLVREGMDLRMTSPRWKVCWDRGQLIDTVRREAFMYFHLNVLRFNDRFRIPTWQVVPDVFCITEDGFSVEWLPGLFAGR